MDPKTIKLTTRQKIRPLLLAINEVIPWQAIVVTCISLYVGIYASINIEVKTDVMIIFILCKLFICALSAGITFALLVFLYFVVDDKIMPTIRKIKEHYREYELAAKKEVLDNVIDDEILRK